jgi:putative oxidoreductase
VVGILGPKGAGGAEVDFLMLAGLLIPLMLGPGALSIDALLRLDRPWTRAPQGHPRGGARLTAVRCPLSAYT